MVGVAVGTERRAEAGDAGRAAVPPAGARDSGRTAGAAAGSSSLEPFRNTVTERVEEEHLGYELAKCRCDCWFCPDCCKVKGYKLRAELIPLLETFRGLIMVSLTVDPLLFVSPKEAFLYMMDRRCVGRTVQDLERGGHLYSKRYFYVVEWQARTEQAHFHVLLDASFIPHDALHASWSKHRPPGATPIGPGRPAFGWAWISKPEFAGGAKHAARYAMKYLIKVPEDGFPAWVLDMGADRRIRRYSTSRGFWNRPPQIRRESEGTSDREWHSYAERIRDCGSSVHVLELRGGIDTDTGEVLERRVWVAQLDASATVLESLSERGSAGPARRFLPVENLQEVFDRVAAVTEAPLRWVRVARWLAGRREACQQA